MIMVSLGVSAAGERSDPAPYRSGRSVVMARHGMVATSHPLAVQIGLDVLKRGGNAVDAAVATSAAMGLLEPMSCGIGGDLYALVWDAKTGKLYGLNASGRAPYAATREYFLQRGMKQIPTTGPLSWSVPGCVDGWAQLLERFGSKSLKELLEPSIRYAEEGVPVPEVIAGYWRAAEKTLSRHPGTARTYLPQGRAPRPGEVFRNPYLARTYRLLAEQGRDAFYRGRIAAEIVAFSRSAGGLFSMKDFQEHTSTWVDPVATTYRGYEIYELPPPGQGISVLQMLNILEGYDLARWGFHAPDYWHVLIETKKLVYADRARYYADPQFAQVPVSQLISKDYADRRRRSIRMDRCLEEVAPGQFADSSDTIYLCVVDEQRNCVSLIQSNYFGFGSGLVPGELGFVLQNRGALFALDEHHPNRLEPGKRPFHTIIPAMALKQGKPWLVFGVMGGDMQPQGQVQVLVNLIDFGMNVQQAGEAPRIEHRGSATPTGLPPEPKGGTVLAERGLPEAIVAELRRRGHRVVHTGTNGGGYQAILIDQATGVLHGASEPRKDGCAAGY